MIPKRGRVKLEGQAYREWTRGILARDLWRCRRCDSKSQLQVHHHPVKRSECRIDEDWNAMTLCAPCHDLVEKHKVYVYGDDCNGLLKFRRREHAAEESGADEGGRDT